MANLEFFYDLSSPWTYLAFNNVQPVLEETGASVTWRPFLVGGVFNAVNPGVYAARAEPMDPKVVHNFRWLREWARLAGLPLTFPTEHHPVKSVLAMRVCCALEHDQSALEVFSRAAFDAYFGEKRLSRCARPHVRLQGDELISMTAEQAIKDHLRANPKRPPAAPMDRRHCRGCLYGNDGSWSNRRWQTSRSRDSPWG